MRNILTVSVAALAVATFSAAGEAQTFQRNGNGGGFNQRSIGTAPGPSLSQRSFTPPSGTRFQQRSVQPPAPGNQVGSNLGNRSFRSVQPPAPNSNVGGGNFANRSFRSVQPPAPNSNVGGSDLANRSFRSVQPPSPNNNAGGGNFASRSIQGVQPPIPTPSGGISSVTQTAAGAAAAVAISQSASTPAAASSNLPTADTGIVGAPIEPVAGSGTTVSTSTRNAQPIDSDLPPLEMLAQVGQPIVPLAVAPAQAATDGRTATAYGRQLRSSIVVESCNVPSHGGARFWRSRY